MGQGVQIDLDLSTEFHLIGIGGQKAGSGFKGCARI